MRELNECKAEAFRRSDNRIKERRRKFNRVLALCVPLCLILTIFSVMMLPGMFPAGMDKAPEADGLSGNATTGDVGKPGNNKEDGNGDKDGAVNTDVPDNLSFSLTWHQLLRQCHGKVSENHGRYKSRGLHYNASA